MAVLIILFILVHTGFTIYMFYDMLADGSYGLFVFSLISYILIWYFMDKSTRDNKQKVYEKNPDFEVTYEEPHIEHPLFEESSDIDKSYIYKEECLIDETLDFDVYLDTAIGKRADWQDAFFGITKHYDGDKR